MHGMQLDADAHVALIRLTLTGKARSGAIRGYLYMSRTGSGRKLMAASSWGLDPSSMTFLKQRGDRTLVCSLFLPAGSGAGHAAHGPCLNCLWCRAFCKREDVQLLSCVEHARCCLSNVMRVPADSPTGGPAASPQPSSEGAGVPVWDWLHEAGSQDLSG